MTGPTHALIGLATVVASGRIAGHVPEATGLVAILLGSLAPDIEGDGSITKPGRLFEVFLGYRIAKGIDGIFQVFAKLTEYIFGHRGFLHSPFVAVLLFACAAAFSSTWLYWFSLGYALHIIADFFTSYGVPLLSPFNKKRFSGSDIKTQSVHELIFASILIFLTVLFGWGLLPDSVKQVHISIYELITR